MPDQPVGAAVDFTGAARPGPRTFDGAHVVLRPLDPELDAAPLFAISHAPNGDPSVWTYLHHGPYPGLDAFAEHLRTQAQSRDQLLFAVVVEGRPQGVISYLSIVPEHGTIELGHIWFAPDLRRTTAATEAIFMLAAHAFDALGYRRLEWKCDSLNQPSRQAALRFGFRFEGVFAQHLVVKGHNRDTAWFAITDTEWPRVRAAFEAWLAPENFDASGGQLTALAARAPSSGTN